MKVHPLIPSRVLDAGAVVAVSEDAVGTFAGRIRSCCTGRSIPRSCSPAVAPSVVACPFGGGGVAGTLPAAADASCVEGSCCTPASRRPCTACASAPSRSHLLG